jgi:hypothetical protein
LIIFFKFLLEKFFIFQDFILFFKLFLVFFISSSCSFFIFRIFSDLTKLLQEFIKDFLFVQNQFFFSKYFSIASNKK